MNRDKNKQNIVLIGMPGVGKTTLGRMLAKSMGREFVDADVYLQNTYGAIAELFAIGEEHFRDCESACIEKLSERCGIVLATGGGVIKRGQNMDKLQEHGVIFFLDRSNEEILAHIAHAQGRPLLQGDKRELLERLRCERYDLYMKYSNYHIRCEAKSTHRIIEEILTIFKRL